MSDVTRAVISGWRTSILATAAFVSWTRLPVSEAENTRRPSWCSAICTDIRAPGAGTDIR
jgi:hypothetical protein